MRVSCQLPLARRDITGSFVRNIMKPPCSELHTGLFSAHTRSRGSDIDHLCHPGYAEFGILKVARPSRSAQLVEVFHKVGPFEELHHLARCAAHQQPGLSQVAGAELFGLKGVGELS